MKTSSQENPIVEACHLTKGFKVSSGFLHRSEGIIHAVNDVSFSISEGETLGLVGESGCGKSTLAKMLLGLIKPDEGELLYNHAPIEKGTRPPFQMVFQDPFSSLDPRMRIGNSVGEPLLAQGADKATIKAKVSEALQNVGLSPELASRYPHQFSGGQRQRIAIARAFITQPRFVVCDEAVSALDASVRAQILNLLCDMQKEQRFACLFISHDLAVVGHMSDRIAVMYLGRLVEVATRDELLSSPIHPYTKALLGAAPSIGQKNVPDIITGEPPSPLKPPSGCGFHPRCPRATEQCRREMPLVQVVSEGHSVACHLAGK